MRIAAAFSEIRPMMRSAMGLRSWSCGGLTVWWKVVPLPPPLKSLNEWDMSLPSRSEWISRMTGRGRGRPSASTLAPTVALNAATQRPADACASDFSLMKS